MALLLDPEKALDTAELPTPPTGWPIGQYPTYDQAQAAVGYLADQGFPVENLTIVGADLMQVERVTQRLTWGRVLKDGAAVGAMYGLFVGMLLSVLAPGVLLLGPILLGLVAGAIIGMSYSALGYSAIHGRRDFSSRSQLVAGRYDVLCEPRQAERARDLLAHWALRQ